MITVEKLEKGTYFDDAFKISFRYDPTTVAKVKELAERRYLPEDRAWEIPAHELPALIEKVGLSNIKSEEAVVQALNTKEIEDKREATQERLKGIKPIRDFDFKTAPLPHQIEAFNYGMEKNSLLIGDEQGLGKTKESIDICVARKKELIKTLIVCGVNSVKYNWEKEIQIHSNESCVMVDGKTMDVRVQQLNDWYRGSAYFGVINIESLRNEKIQDALYLGIKDGYIGAIIVDEIHKAKNGGSQQGKALRFLKAPVKIGLSGTPMNKAEDLWNILTWLGVERRSFYSFKNAYCTMGGFGGYKVIGYKNLNDLNAELNTVMLRRKKEEVLDLPPKLYSTEYVELTTAQKKQYRDIKNGIVADMENILASVNPLNCTLRLRQLTSGNPNLTDDSPKLDRIKEMLEEEIIPNGHKAIIFSQWSTIAKDLGIELSEYDPIVITGEVPPEQRQRLVDNFQTNPHCKVAIGTIGAMGTGLTLNKASYVFFMDKAWNSGDNAQAEDRAHRIGTVGAVNVISMVAKGTIDEAVEDYLLENKDLIDRVVDGKGSKQDIKTILKEIQTEALENHLNRLEKNIHKFSAVPDLSDENFAGNLSGVAIRFKLFGLETKCIIKERKMEKAIKELVRVLSVPIHVNTGREVDVLNLKVEFSRNVPNNLTEIVDTVTKLDGKVDKETLLSLLPFIDNPKEVLEKLEADKERDRQSTDPYSTQNITEDSNNLFPNLNAQNSPQEALNAQGATIPQPEQ